MSAGYFKGFAKRFGTTPLSNQVKQQNILLVNSCFWWARVTAISFQLTFLVLAGLSSTV